MSDIFNTQAAPRFPLPKLDWIWALILLSPLLWWVLSQLGYDLIDTHGGHRQLVSQPWFVANSLLHIAPYFAFAVALGAYAVASDASEVVNRAFRYNQPVAIALAAVAGVVSAARMRSTTSR